MVLEPHNPVGVHRQVGDYEADFGEQLVRMPFDLGNHTARLIPGRRMILEVLEGPLHFGQLFAMYRRGLPPGMVPPWLVTYTGGRSAQVF